MFDDAPNDKVTSIKVVHTPHILMLSQRTFAAARWSRRFIGCRDNQEFDKNLEQVEKSCLNSQGVVEWGPRIALLSKSFLTFYDAGIYPLARRKRIHAHLQAFSSSYAQPSSLLLPQPPALSHQTTRIMRPSWTRFLWCKSSQLHPSMSRARILKALS